MKNTIIKTPFFILILFICSMTSCVKDDIDNSLLQNFEILWTDFNENYAAFKQRNIDWEAIYSVYQPRAAQATTEEELFIICSQMVLELEDGHCGLYNRDDEEWDDGSPITELKDIYDIELIQSKYLQEGYETSQSNINIPAANHLFGKIKNENIAYMHLFEFEGIEGGWENKMDQYISDIADKDALIIDLRLNNGGSPQLAIYLAGRFSSTKATGFLLQTKNGPGPNDFDTPTEIFTEPVGNSQYTKPIVVLTDNNSVSAAEDMLMLMKTQDHVTQIGETTRGIHSNISLQRFLPIGWTYHYTHQLITFLDGTSPEGVGIHPDVEVINTTSDWNGGTDKVLEAAIEYLK